ncbi:tannase/feruloyl esterase family alpha/beta hydrolase [Microbacterium excoecariae]|uniref:tannase/feruloyl esterase family alpha/beta hydrolase n=1 Tax=Microbacterium excoecariae TaxID=2715210 RepID=UPI0014093DFC|nr:tannase/feruloyl esterase family alpha/beta hydrolase [Microbacterium excoecariae]
MAAPAAALDTSFQYVERASVGSVIEHCGELARTYVADDSGVEVTAVVASAVSVAADDGEPACELSGTIDGRVGFTVQLPTDTWNGRYFQTGCGGFCGYVPIDSCAAPLAAGFAVAAEDTGHADPTGGAEWGAMDADARADWGYRSPHLLAVSAKQIIHEAYGASASASYFQGCSTGGRQALSEAQRYPDDFDGIIAGAPALYQNYLAVLSQGGYERINRRDDGTAILTAEAVDTLAAAVQDACGGVDGVVADPMGCDFSPETLTCVDGAAADCLSPEQVDVVQRLYAPPVADDGTVLYPAGLPLGSESLWMGMAVGTDEAYSGGGGYAQNVLRYLAFPESPGAEYALTDFDPSTQYRELDAMAEVYNADDADLSEFAASGGKLILYHGLADALITPYGTVEYLEAVADKMGAGTVDNFARLFLLPGVSHCTGGPGEDTVDWLGSLVDWVENDSAPTQVEATKLTAGEIASARTVAAYELGSGTSWYSDWFASAGANPVGTGPVEPEAPAAEDTVAAPTAPVEPSVDGTAGAAEETAAPLLPTGESPARALTAVAFVAVLVGAGGLAVVARRRRA